MAKKQTPLQNWFQYTTARTVKIHFAYVFALAVTIIAFDAWKLITPQSLRDRWTVTALMLIAVSVLWYLARQRANTTLYYRTILYVLVGIDIAVAAFNVYVGRGMASRAVALFAIPIVVSAVLLSRTAVMATAAICSAAYSLAAIQYFVAHPSEGYKVEMYGDIVFYSAIFFVIASLLWVIIRAKQTSTS